MWEIREGIVDKGIGIEGGTNKGEGIVRSGGYCMWYHGRDGTVGECMGITVGVQIREGITGRDMGIPAGTNSRERVL